eukprot:CAMPEP_0184505524 /NCGR_PEP_ID=MMETSP0113_2-20130426/53030_1 /TAXON_ID=91329 /ORGANISM="Norrisiella sphaerica, Strain BC52" /LENGTH=1003 /DNA_ID=CAMNT_0026895217 /DNA_START=262 /DNA_END=3270 /DNA_ORIENTATION=+
MKSSRIKPSVPRARPMRKKSLENEPFRSRPISNGGDTPSSNLMELTEIVGATFSGLVTANWNLWPPQNDEDEDEARVGINGFCERSISKEGQIPQLDANMFAFKRRAPLAESEDEYNFRLYDLTSVALYGANYSDAENDGSSRRSRLRGLRRRARSRDQQFARKSDKRGELTPPRLPPPPWRDDPFALRLPSTCRIQQEVIKQPKWVCSQGDDDEQLTLFRESSPCKDQNALDDKSSYATAGGGAEDIEEMELDSSGDYEDAPGRASNESKRRKRPASKRKRNRARKKLGGSCSRNSSTALEKGELADLSDDLIEQLREYYHDFHEHRLFLRQHQSQLATGGWDGTCKQMFADEKDLIRQMHRTENPSQSLMLALADILSRPVAAIAECWLECEETLPRGLWSLHLSTDLRPGVKRSAAEHLRRQEEEALAEALRASLEIETKCYGEEHPLVLRSKLRRACALHAMGDFKEARRLLEEIVATEEKQISEDKGGSEVKNGEQSTSKAAVSTLGGVGSGRMMLGNLLMEMGDYSEAKRHFQKMIEQESAAHGAEHPAVGIAHANLGAACFQLSEIEKGKACLAKAVKVFTAVVGESHLYTKISRSFLESLTDELQRDVQKPGHPRLSAEGASSVVCDENSRLSLLNDSSIAESTTLQGNGKDKSQEEDKTMGVQASERKEKPPGEQGNLRIAEPGKMIKNEPRMQPGYSVIEKGQTEGRLVKGESAMQKGPQDIATENSTCTNLKALRTQTQNSEANEKAGGGDGEILDGEKHVNGASSEGNSLDRRIQAKVDRVLAMCRLVSGTLRYDPQEKFSQCDTHQWCEHLTQVLKEERAARANLVEDLVRGPGTSAQAQQGQSNVSESASSGRSASLPLPDSATGIPADSARKAERPGQVLRQAPLPHRSESKDSLMNNLGALLREGSHAVKIPVMKRGAGGGVTLDNSSSHEGSNNHREGSQQSGEAILSTSSSMNGVPNLPTVAPTKRKLMRSKGNLVQGPGYRFFW